MSLRPVLSAALLVPCLAAAAELGRLTVLSGVGEPLRAEIEIVALRPGEAAALGARIPAAEVFWRANLEPAPVIDRLRVAVERRPQDRYVVALRSSGAIDEPFIQLLVELTSPAGSIVREYPFLLEEPRARQPHALAAPAPPGAAVSLPVAPPAGGYLVRAGDTLAGIAETLRPSGVTLEQTIVALYRANESAFIDGDMNRLRAHAALAVPTEAATRAIDAATARRLVREHRAVFEQHRERLVAAAPAAESPARAARDRLRLSGGDDRTPGAAASTAREDDLTALQHAFGETKERIAALEKNVADVTRLLTLRNTELARLQREGPADMLVLASAEAADASSDPSARSGLAGLLYEHGAWLVAALLAGFVSWIVMPFKTLRLWLKKRRRHARKARRAAERVRRAAREAGLLPSTV